MKTLKISFLKQIRHGIPLTATFVCDTKEVSINSTLSLRKIIVESTINLCIPHHNYRWYRGKLHWDVTCPSHDSMMMNHTIVTLRNSSYKATGGRITMQLSSLSNLIIRRLTVYSSYDSFYRIETDVVLRGALRGT